MGVLCYTALDSMSNVVVCFIGQEFLLLHLAPQSFTASFEADSHEEELFIGSSLVHLLLLKVLQVEMLLSVVQWSLSNDIESFLCSLKYQSYPKYGSMLPNCGKRRHDERKRRSEGEKNERREDVKGRRLGGICLRIWGS
jgi:hypothetical protein